MPLTIDGVPVTQLMEVATNRILKAQNEVKYIIQRAEAKGNLNPQLKRDIQIEFNDLKHTAARLLSYLVMLDKTGG